MAFCIRKCRLKRITQTAVALSMSSMFLVSDVYAANVKQVYAGDNSIKQGWVARFDDNDLVDRNSLSDSYYETALKQQQEKVTSANSKIDTNVNEMYALYASYAGVDLKQEENNPMQSGFSNASKADILAMANALGKPDLAAYIQSLEKDEEERRKTVSKVRKLLEKYLKVLNDIGDDGTTFDPKEYMDIGANDNSTRNDVSFEDLTQADLSKIVADIFLDPDNIMLGPDGLPIGKDGKAISLERLAKQAGMSVDELKKWLEAGRFDELMERLKNFHQRNLDDLFNMGQVPARDATEKDMEGDVLVCGNDAKSTNQAFPVYCSNCNKLIETSYKKGFGGTSLCPDCFGNATSFTVAHNLNELEQEAMALYPESEEERCKLIKERMEAQNITGDESFLIDAFMKLKSEGYTDADPGMVTDNSPYLYWCSTCKQYYSTQKSCSCGKRLVLNDQYRLYNNVPDDKRIADTNLITGFIAASSEVGDYGESVIDNLVKRNKDTDKISIEDIASYADPNYSYANPDNPDHASLSDQYNFYNVEIKENADGGADSVTANGKGYLTTTVSQDLLFWKQNTSTILRCSKCRRALTSDDVSSLYYGNGKCYCHNCAVGKDANGNEVNLIDQENKKNADDYMKENNLLSFEEMDNISMRDYEKYHADELKKNFAEKVNAVMVKTGISKDEASVYVKEAQSEGYYDPLKGNFCCSVCHNVVSKGDMSYASSMGYVCSKCKRSHDDFKSKQEAYGNMPNGDSRESIDATMNENKDIYDTLEKMKVVSIVDLSQKVDVNSVDKLFKVKVMDDIALAEAISGDNVKKNINDINKQSLSMYCALLDKLYDWMKQKYEQMPVLDGSGKYDNKINEAIKKMFNDILKGGKTPETVKNPASVYDEIAKKIKNDPAFSRFMKELCGEFPADATKRTKEQQALYDEIEEFLKSSTSKAAQDMLKDMEDIGLLDLFDGKTQDEIKDALKENIDILKEMEDGAYYDISDSVGMTWMVDTDEGVSTGETVNWTEIAGCGFTITEAKTGNKTNGFWAGGTGQYIFNTQGNYVITRYYKKFAMRRSVIKHLNRITWNIDGYGTVYEGTREYYELDTSGKGNQNAVLMEAPAINIHVTKGDSISVNGGFRTNRVL